MAGIKVPLQALVGLCAGVSGIQYARVWNNQLQYMREGSLYNFPMPAAFVEIQNVTYKELGQYFQDADLHVRIHLCHENYNNLGTGTLTNMEQDYAIFDLRDSVIRSITSVEMTACGPLVKVGETLDYAHDNVYHYIIDFVCSFVDSTGSPYDPASGKFTPAPDPLALRVDVNYQTQASVGYAGTDPENRVTTPQAQNNYKIPQ